ncbi:MAG: phosphoribosylanthranilate isomerase [Acidimicrobiia bacterium]
MFVKICGITNEEDALLAVAMGADALGFVFAPSKRMVGVQTVHDIVRRLPANVITVGVFRDELPERIVDIVREAGLTAAQLHGHEPPAVTQAVRRDIRLVIQAFPAEPGALDRAGEYGADIVLVDSASPGSGQLFDWRLVDGAPPGMKLLLAGGLAPDNVAEAIRVVRPWGVDVSTGVESSPGRKDAVKLKAFIDNARAAAPKPYLGDDEMPYDWRDE